jgi:hypothetical protein
MQVPSDTRNARGNPARSDSQRRRLYSWDLIRILGHLRLGTSLSNMLFLRGNRGFALDPNGSAVWNSRVRLFDAEPCIQNWRIAVLQGSGFGYPGVPRLVRRVLATPRSIIARKKQRYFLAWVYTKFASSILPSIYIAYAIPHLRRQQTSQEAWCE